MAEPATFRIGARVTRPSAKWRTNEDGSWPPGVGIGEIVESQHSSAHSGKVEVRWHESQRTEGCEDLLPAESTAALDELAVAWIAAEEGSDHGSPAIQTVIHLSYDAADLCWGFVQTVLRKGVTAEIRAALAVGPVEDLLVYFPNQYFERVKALGTEDDAFRVSLRMVWLDGNDSPIWREFYDFVGTEPPFPPGWDES